MTFETALHFVEYDLQIIALTWMAVPYTIKAVQLSRLPMPWEQGPARGSATGGVARSMVGIFMPTDILYVPLSGAHTIGGTHGEVVLNRRLMDNEGQGMAG